MTCARNLQDWISVSGNANVVTQGEVDWLDISGFQDVILNMELAVVSSSSNTYLDIQSSPTKDEAFFGASLGAAYLYRYSLSGSSPRGVQTPVVIRWATATNQLPARYLRWRLTFPSGLTYITFRVVLGLNRAAWGLKEPRS
jgi:hypothetical protein